MTAPPTGNHAGTAPATTRPAYPATWQGIRAALHALGNNQAGVAAALDAAGYRGEPGESTHCPVAAYLLGTLDAGPLQPDSPIAVGDTTVTVFRADNTRFEVDLPEPVRRFVDAFDAGHYPALRPDDYTDPEQTDPQRGDLA
jgi:hypothetical protein